MQTTNPDSPDRDLAERYAEAVALFLRTGIPQGISYSQEDRAFYAESATEGCAPDEWDLYVGQLWRQLVPNLCVQTIPSEPDYDEGVLRSAVRDSLLARPGLATAIIAQRAREATERGLDS